MALGDNRTIPVGNAGTMIKVVKQPGDTFIYVFDFTTWIDVGTEVITGATVGVNTTGTPPTVTVLSNTTNTVSVKCVGGSDGAIGTITLTTTFSDTEVKTAELSISIKEFP